MNKVSKKIIRHSERCNGCLVCQLECSLAHDNYYADGPTGISLIALEEEPSFLPLICSQCDDPACANVCPTGARTKNDLTGIVEFDQEKCVRCKMCLLVCPTAAVKYDQETDRIQVCDFCQSEEPACVAACPKHALSLRDVGPLWDELADKADLVSPGIAACQGCAGEWVLRFTVKALGPNTVMGLPPCCMSATGVVGYGLNTGADIPITFTHLGNAASMMAGVKRHFQRRGQEVNVVAFAGDGGTADIGLQALSGAAERQENIIYICYDNEAYMNTGIQRSSTTPSGAWTTTTPVGANATGKKQSSKNLPLIMLMHNLPYMATASPAFPQDYYRKLQKAKEVKDGLAYIHVLAPCPVGWRFPSEKSMEVSRLAVLSNFFPLWEAEYGEISFTQETSNPLPIDEYTKMIGKYRHLSSKEIASLQHETDARFRKLKLLADRLGS